MAGYGTSDYWDGGIYIKVKHTKAYETKIFAIIGSLFNNNLFNNLFYFFGGSILPNVKNDNITMTAISGSDITRIVNEAILLLIEDFNSLVWLYGDINHLDAPCFSSKCVNQRPSIIGYLVNFAMLQPVQGQ